VDKKPSKLFFSPVKEKKSAKFSIVFFLASLYTIILYGTQALTNNLSIVTTLSILFCSVLFLLVVVKNIYLSSIIV